uniref:NADH dehydrogenase subunit 2 n=1 Tax=Desbruyeresia armata TaxID=2591852 RepID=UPI0026E20E96|nr:NADH dehydrogenase subunit 2 [Desbruyeresia armata]WJK73063.1 NADH dehydrogenase subunit 2 [Desbruyeresia armata]
MFSSLPFSYVFFFMAVFGTVFSVSSCHWLGIWGGLEINLIGFVPLLVYQKSMSESESAVKYFVMQALGSSLLMFGSLSAYSMSFSWDSLSSLSLFSYLSLMVITSGLVMKMGVFPFHFWFPGVMAGLPWLTCLLLATWQKVAPLFLVASLFELNVMFWFFIVLALIGSGSSLIGGLGGMNQTQIRALLAYSSIGHLGWIVFGMVHSSWVMKAYFSIYVLISFCIFVSLWYLNSSISKNLGSLVYLNFFGLSIMVMLLSLGGLPPLLGFISKWVVILMSMEFMLWPFTALLILGSLMSLFYYLSLFFSYFLSSSKLVQLNLIKLSKENTLVGMGMLMNLLGGLCLISSVTVWGI